MNQYSLVILKPDAVQRRLTGTIIQRFENAGLKIHAARFEMINAEMSKQHYAEHVEKSFYPSLESYITSGPIFIMVLSGFEAIGKIRRMIGETVPAKAAPGTIRGDFSHQGNSSEVDSKNQSPLRNLIHASANVEDAKREIALWFQPEEMIDYPLADDYLHGI